MNSQKNISRREIIFTGLAAALSPVILPAQSYSRTQLQAISSPDEPVVVVGSSDPGFEEAMDRLFPGLLHDEHFQKFKSLSLLITNRGRKGIKAFSSHWAIEDGGRHHERTISHHFHPTAHRAKSIHYGIRGHKKRFTGAIRVLRSGQTRLVTPFFSWTSKYYQNAPRIKWKRILHNAHRHQEGMVRFRAANLVRVSIDAVVTTDHKIYGPDNGKLGDKFRIARNAEHDEAVIIRRVLRRKKSFKKVIAYLKKRTGPIRPGTPKLSRYRRVRRRQAKMLLHYYQKHLKRSGTPKIANKKLLAALRYLRRRPKTILTRG